MRFAFDDAQQALRESARKFLGDHASSERTRAAMESPLGYDPEVWRRVGQELGWTAVTIPEAYGGFGLGTVELVAIVEEMGRCLFCSPFLATVGLGANALLLAGNEAQRQAWLPGIAAGTTTATLAATGTRGRWTPEAVTTVAIPVEGGGYRLSGEERFVLDGHTADLVVVAVRAPETTGSEGIGLMLVTADSPGFERRPLPTMDMTRRMGALTLTDYHVPSDAVLCPPGEGAAALERILERARIALAAEQAGAAEACLEMAVEYAKVRVQFGRPIGSFQAIKHMCADMMLQVESAKSAAYYAAWAASTEADDLAEASLIAQTYCSEAFFHCAAQNIQIHGGIGFTWEHDAHLYFKRARASEQLLGEPNELRERMATLMEL
ncbi:MAG: acyl-CoA dehydrogenase family protein [Myxococcota bacterium]